MKRILEIGFWLMCLVGGTLCVILVGRAAVSSHQYKPLAVVAVVGLAVVNAARYLVQALRSETYDADNVKRDT
jgi:lipid-A-disaccharide synthase-like uncharacterized protein